MLLRLFYYQMLWTFVHIRVGDSTTARYAFLNIIAHLRVIAEDAVDEVNAVDGAMAKQSFFF